MCLGQSGLGKSTFINSLFSAEINDPTPRAERSFSPTTQIEEKTVRLIENGVILNLTLVDCPGFGDAIDNNKWLVGASIEVRFILIQAKENPFHAKKTVIHL